MLVWQPVLVSIPPGLAGARVAVGPVAIGLAVVAYSVAETRAFVLRTADVPVLPAGQRPLRLLHLSDLHLTPAQGIKQRWIRALQALEPDLVIVTGDFLGHRSAVAPLLACLGGLLDRPGAYVLGSNDYFAPIVKNPLRYLVPARQAKTRLGQRLPWGDLTAALAERGWVDLNNRRARVRVCGRDVALAGVDDPHLGYDDLAAVSHPAEAADLAIAVTHAPYLRVLDGFTTAGYPLVLAGHTHGGQLRVPGFGALVTNCDLERRRARGLGQHTVGDRAAWLHVSAGLGTSPYAPLRFCCRPEATLLTLRPA